VANTIDPLGGSYYVEALTNELEQGAHKYFERIDKLGGVIPAIEKGFFQKEISRSAYQYQKALEKHEKFHVGVNIFEDDQKPKIEILSIPREVERKQIQGLKRIKKERNNRRVKESLKLLRKAAVDGANLMPRIIDCVREYTTIGEMCNTLKEEFGIYHEPIIF
jgi:methylmalonyl-CoA mutase N-terminal domain/subunit